MTEFLYYLVVLGSNIIQGITGFAGTILAMPFAVMLIGIDKSKFIEINKIFVEKTVNKSMDYACPADYRDILIFKNKNKTVGIAKICFECFKNQILGTKANTENFGQDGDYEKLEKLLKK